MVARLNQQACGMEGKCSFNGSPLFDIFHSQVIAYSIVISTRAYLFRL